MKRPYLLPTTHYLLILLIGLFGCQRQHLYKENQILMGTFVEVTSTDQRAGGIVFDEIERVENLLSKYKQNSDIWRLNKFGEARVSEETIYIIKKAKNFYKETEGAFDITVGPLLELWGFKDKKYKLPEQGDIKNTLGLIGSDKIILDEGGQYVQLQDNRMQLDLGGLAKGYALDCAVKKLKQAGIGDALLNAGGDIYCLGNKFSQPWRVAIRDPRTERFIKDLELKDKAVATSGDYEQYFFVKDERYSHILNPKTGFPSESGVISVTVVAGDCLSADALATSIFILGKSKGEKLVKKFNAKIVNIVME